MKRILGLIFIAFCFVTAPEALAKKDAFYTSWRDNIALGGFDTVSFFSGKPQEGQKAFSHIYDGAEFRFSTRANLDLFKTNPDAFIPQYGGYCAWAVAHDKLAKGSPKYWRVVDGKLYLNFNARIQRRWNKKTGDYINNADRIWPDILDD